MRILIFSILSLASLLGAVDAWSKMGHQLVAGIAKKRLSSDAVQKIESLLAEWDKVHGGGATMEDAAVWLDEIAEPQALTGWTFFENITVLKHYHYSQHVYNPQSIELNGIYNFFPLPRSDSSWFLHTVYKALLATVSTSTPTEPSVGTIFSLNLHLRSLLHLFGDIHQPLHNIETFIKAFPDGDAGGNAIVVAHPDMPAPKYPMTLHHFWDMMGEIDTSALTAEGLMEKYPYDSLVDKVTGQYWGNNFIGICTDSSEIAKSFSYSLMDWATYDGTSPVPLPRDYIQKTKDICQTQVVIAGYRLSNLLEHIAKVLPDPKQCANYYVEVLEMCPGDYKIVEDFIIQPLRHAERC